MENVGRNQRFLACIAKSRWNAQLSPNLEPQRLRFRGSRSTARIHSLLGRMPGFDDPEADPFDFCDQEDEPIGQNEGDEWDHLLPNAESHQEHCALFLPEQEEQEPPEMQAGQFVDNPVGQHVLPVIASPEEDSLEQWEPAQFDPYMQVENNVPVALPEEAGSAAGWVYETPPKRRRISQKSTPDPKDVWAAHKEKLMCPAAIKHMRALVRSTYNAHAVRDVFMQWRRPTLRLWNPQASFKTLTAMMRDEWAAKCEPAQACWMLERFREDGIELNRNSQPTTAEQVKDAAADAIAEEKELMKEDKHWFRTAACMGTWNGSWLEGNPEYQQFLGEHGFKASIVPAMLELRCVKWLIGQFEKFLQARVDKLGFKHWSFVFEMSLNGNQQGRLHIHAYWQTESSPSNHKVFAGAPRA